MLFIFNHPKTRTNILLFKTLFKALIARDCPDLDTCPEIDLVSTVSIEDSNQDRQSFKGFEIKITAIIRRKKHDKGDIK